MKKREDYLKFFKKQLDEQIAGLNQLKIKAQDKVADQKKEIQKRIDDLEINIKKAKKGILKLETAAEEKWDEVKKITEVALREIAGTFKASKKAVAKKQAVKPAVPKSKKAKATTGQGIKKQYFKSKDICRVTFRMPKSVVDGEAEVCIVGEFNGWDYSANPMKRLKTGEYTITLDLAPGEHQYRYLINQIRWENDIYADKFIKSPFGDSENSVVIV